MNKSLGNKTATTILSENTRKKEEYHKNLIKEWRSYKSKQRAKVKKDLVKMEKKSQKIKEFEKMSKILGQNTGADLENNSQFVFTEWTQIERDILNFCRSENTVKIEDLQFISAKNYEKLIKITHPNLVKIFKRQAVIPSVLSSITFKNIYQKYVKKFKVGWVASNKIKHFFEFLIGNTAYLEWSNKQYIKKIKKSSKNEKTEKNDERRRMRQFNENKSQYKQEDKAQREDKDDQDSENFKLVVEIENRIIRLLRNFFKGGPVDKELLKPKRQDYGIHFNSFVKRKKKNDKEGDDDKKKLRKLKSRKSSTRNKRADKDNNEF